MIDQKIIKNVVLDLGGVLVDIEPEETYAAFKRIFLPDVLLEIKWDELPEVVMAMETGQWSKTKFKKTMLQSCKPGVSASQMVDAWCAMLLEFRAPRVKMVQDLAEKYNIYLLSNTNIYHVGYFEKEFMNRFHFPLKDLFTKVYYSNEIGFRKPDNRAFEHVMADAGIKAEETVLVDDNADNCDAAKALGFNVVQVPHDSGLEAVIRYLL